jgi:hypothetical protein
MLVVVANAWDPRGAWLRDAWHSTGALLLIPADLSRRGWSFDPAAPADGYAVLQRRRVRVARISGVCALLPGVGDSDLPHIVAEDRGYVAAEMNAFLCAWLTAIPCPKVNPPSPASPCGPAWRPDRWVHLAARLGLPTRAVTRNVSCRGPSPSATVRAGTAARTLVVAGDRVVGGTVGQAVSAAESEWAASLAQAAGTRMLSVHIGVDQVGTFVLGADTWVDVSRPGVAEALRAVLAGDPVPS